MMTYYPDTDPWMELEALETERLDADLEMAEGAAVGNAIAAAQRRGVCCHTSTAGYIRPAVYPEQEDLKPGQLACTEHTGGCARVFEGTDEWVAAMDAATS
jgi:hypothetical protein